jgi:hypothetical protein
MPGTTDIKGITQQIIDHLPAFADYVDVRNPNDYFLNELRKEIESQFSQMYSNGYDSGKARADKSWQAIIEEAKLSKEQKRKLINEYFDNEYFDD